MTTDELLEKTNIWDLLHVNKDRWRAISKIEIPIETGIETKEIIAYGSTAKESLEKLLEIIKC